LTLAVSEEVLEVSLCLGAPVFDSGVRAFCFDIQI
jgi:hypothetical protein